MSKRLDKSFEEWIEEKGMPSIARKLGVRVSTVFHWKAKRTLPKAHHMRMIKKLTRGRVDYTHMIEGSLSPLNR